MSCAAVLNQSSKRAPAGTSSCWSCYASNAFIHNSQWWGETMLDSKHVLVAEDNDVNYTLVAFILDKQGLTVSRAATGEQALERTLDEKPDLVLMDIQLP